jgi:flagellar biosynthetic protein FliQ
MDTATVVDMGRQALWMTMLISAPMLLVGLLVGLIVGIFQAATSINEQTLSFIPKLLAIGLTAAIFGGWMINSLVDYTKILYGRIPGFFYQSSQSSYTLFNFDCPDFFLVFAPGHSAH